MRLQKLMSWDPRVSSVSWVFTCRKNAEEGTEVACVKMVKGVEHSR